MQWEWKGEGRKEEEYISIRHQMVERGNCEGIRSYSPIKEKKKEEDEKGKV